jgi:hypothetical protein
VTDEQVLANILSLAEREDSIRAVLIEVSRANPNAAADNCAALILLT